MTDHPQVFDKLAWHDHWQWSPGASSSDASSLVLTLNLAGYELVKSGGLDKLQQLYRDAFFDQSGSRQVHLLQVELRQPDRLQDMGLPAQPPFSLIRYWYSVGAKQSFLIEVNPELEMFAGHFPGRPILPGIMQLHWANQLAETFLYRTAQATEVRQLKFKNVFIPPGYIELEFHEMERDRLDFCLSSAVGIHAQGQLIYAG